MKLPTLFEISPGGCRILLPLGVLGRGQQDLGVLGQEFQGFLEVTVRGGRPEFRKVPKAIEISQPRLGVVRDHPRDLVIGGLGVLLVKFGAIEPCPLGVAQEAGRIVRDRLAVSVCGRLEIRLLEKAIALEFLELGELQRGTGHLGLFIHLLGSLSEQNLEMAPGVGGSCRTELEGQIQAASFQCRVALVVAQRFLVDQKDLFTAPGGRCDLIQHPGILPPGFRVAWLQAQILPECFSGLGCFTLFLVL